MDQFVHADAEGHLASVAAVVARWPRLTITKWKVGYTSGSRSRTREKGKEVWRGGDVRHLHASPEGRVEALVHSKMSCRLYYYSWIVIALEGEHACEVVRHGCACPTAESSLCAHASALYYSILALQFIGTPAGVSGAWPPGARPFKLAAGGEEMDILYAPWRRWTPRRLVLSSCNAIFGAEHPTEKGAGNIVIAWAKKQGSVKFESGYVRDIQLGRSLEPLAGLKTAARVVRIERKKAAKATVKAAAVSEKASKKRPHKGKSTAAGAKQARVGED